MSNESFTTKELDILFEALDALESKQATDSALSSMLGVMVIRDEEEREKFMNKQELELAAAKEKNRNLREQIILLKAKLIGMKDREYINELNLDELK